MSNCNVLLVENSKTARVVMTKLLEAKGYSVTAVGNGLGAIEGAKTGQFDVIVMDLYMPQMNGYEAAKKIRMLDGEGAQVPMIALTASTDTKDKQICEDAGMNHFVLKSENNAELFDVLQQYNR
ncbi:MAG: hypothetical protein CMF48_02250 [Legionellales bacterium]|nr:hypothetical protein [Legionellales bacterium]|tara:strand:+ start:730 stop:1101 length:372 start_codon:yes stop_codon:yes gene_type:complete